MSYTFEKATPVPQTGGGAKEQPNPFTEAVASIAWKNDPETGKPLALSFVEEHDAENEAAIAAKIARLLSKAGRALETPGTVRRNAQRVTDKKGEVIGTRFTFWVVKLQERPRKTVGNDK